MRPFHSGSLLLLAVALLPPAAFVAAEHRRFRWSPAYAYAQKTLIVGTDYIKLYWNGTGAHNVWRFPSVDDYNNCNFDFAIGDPEAQIPAVESDHDGWEWMAKVGPFESRGKYYFGCSVGSHCEGGFGDGGGGMQKLTVKVAKKTFTMSGVNQCEEVPDDSEEDDDDRRKELRKLRGLSSTCPAESPNPGDACGTEGEKCSYGEECCCGDCFDSFICECDGGSFQCLHSDACMVPEIKCPDYEEDAAKRSGEEGEEDPIATSDSTTVIDSGMARRAKFFGKCKQACNAEPECHGFSFKKGKKDKKAKKDKRKGKGKDKDKLLKGTTKDENEDERNKNPSVKGGDNDGTEMILCPEDMKECPDGSLVNRDEKCNFNPCPGDEKGCREDAKICKDGKTSVGRNPKNGCEFDPCPEDDEGGGGVKGCTKDLRECPDGTMVGRNGKNNCEFRPCPDEGKELSVSNVFKEPPVCTLLNVIPTAKGNGKKKDRDFKCIKIRSRLFGAVDAGGYEYDVDSGVASDTK